MPTATQTMVQKKRTRASHPKVRTGCHTCKARRVKCDEQRPACSKCVTTGRKCEGYQDRRDWVVIVAPPRPLTDGFEDDRSRRHFDYFRTQAVHELSWFFEGGPWSTLVLQESHCSPAIRHAVIALACSHEDSRENYVIANQAPQYAYAAKHYSKAIRNLIKETAHDQHESRMRALMCGLLFISLEIIRGNNAIAMGHLEGCLKIVREAQSRSEPIPLFSRVDAQPSLFMCRKPQDESILPTVWDSEPPAVLWDPTEPPQIEGHQPFYCFDTVLQALSALCSITSKVHSFMGWHSDLYRSQCHTPIPADVLLQKITLNEQLMQWDTAVQLLINSGTLKSAHDYDKIQVLRVHNRTALTLIETCLESSECVFDRYYWAFEDIVNLITELQGRPQQDIGNGGGNYGRTAWNGSVSDEGGNESDDTSTPESSYTQSHGRSSPCIVGDGSIERTKSCLHSWTRPFLPLDNGIIFALYWTALKCRDPYLRRRAITLLSQSTQEGQSFGKIQAAIAKRVVELEESVFVFTKEVPMGGLMTAEDVKEEVRVYTLGADIDKAAHRAKLSIWTRDRDYMGKGKDDDPDLGLKERIEWVVW